MVLLLHPQPLTLSHIQVTEARLNLSGPNQCHAGGGQKSLSLHGRYCLRVILAPGLMGESLGEQDPRGAEGAVTRSSEAAQFTVMTVPLKFPTGAQRKLPVI